MAEAGVSSGEMEDFRANVRESMERELRQRISDKLKTQVLDALLETNPIEVPQAMIDQAAINLRESLTRSLGGGKSGGKPQPLPFSDEFYFENARRRVAIGLLVSEAIKHYDLRVTEEAVREKVTEIAASYEQPQEVISHYLSDQNRLLQVHETLLEERLVEQLLAEAQVEDEPTDFFALAATA
jgi:trigger factor